MFSAVLALVAAPQGAGQTRSSAVRTDEEAIKAVIAATTDAFSRRATSWVK